MSDVTVSGATAADDVTFTHVDPNAKPKRAKGVTEKVFAATYQRMAKAGNTSKEIAAELGMNESSLVSRGSALRKLLKGAGYDLPYPKTERGQGAKQTRLAPDALRAFLEGLDGTSTVG